MDILTFWAIVTTKLSKLSPYYPDTRVASSQIPIVVAVGSDPPPIAKRAATRLQRGPAVPLLLIGS